MVGSSELSLARWAMAPSTLWLFEWLWHLAAMTPTADPSVRSTRAHHSSRTHLVSRVAHYVVRTNVGSTVRRNGVGALPLGPSIPSAVVRTKPTPSANWDQLDDLVLYWHCAARKLSVAVAAAASVGAGAFCGGACIRPFSGAESSSVFSFY